MNNSRDMTKGNPTGLIVRFAMPLIIGNIFQQLYTVTDAAIVGKGVGLNALAAIGTTDWLIWLFFGMVQGSAQGFSVLVSQVFGAADGKRLKNMRAMSEILSVIVTAAVMLFGLLAQPLMFNLLNIPAEVYEMAKAYYIIIVLGLPCFMFYNLYASLLRAIGNSRIPFIAIVVASLTNIALDSIAVFVLKMGIRGAAYATVFAQLISGIICFIPVVRSKDLKYQRSELELTFDEASALLKIGLPIAAQNLVISIGGVVMTSVVNSFGTAFIAGFISANKLYGLLEIAALSFGLAVTTYVGQNYGAGKIDRIREGTFASIKISLVIAVVMGGLVTIFARQLCGLFISSDDIAIANEALGTGAFYLRLMGIFLTVLYMIYILRFSLQGMGDSVSSLVSAGVELVIRVIASITAGALGTPRLIIWTEIMAWIGGFTVVLIAFIKRMKKLRLVSEDE